MAYVYEDGYRHDTLVKLTGKQIKEDEKTHGDLLFLVTETKRRIATCRKE